MAGRKMSAAQKAAVGRRMKRYWAKRRKEKKVGQKLWEASVAAEQTKVPFVPTPATPSMVVRVIATRDQGDGPRIVIHEHGVNSWGDLIDLLHDSYDGIFTEARITKQ